MNTSTSTTTQEFTVSVFIDKAAALLAGHDEYGSTSHAIKPSQLTDKQREILAALDFAIHSSDVGAPISVPMNGSEPCKEIQKPASRKASRVFYCPMKSSEILPSTHRIVYVWKTSKKHTHWRTQNS